MLVTFHDEVNTNFSKVHKNRLKIRSSIVKDLEWGKAKSCYVPKWRVRIDFFLFYWLSCLFLSTFCHGWL